LFFFVVVVFLHIPYFTLFGGPIKMVSKYVTIENQLSELNSYTLTQTKKIQ